MGFREVYRISTREVRGMKNEELIKASITEINRCPKCNREGTMGIITAFKKPIYLYCYLCNSHIAIIKEIEWLVEF